MQYIGQCGPVTISHPSAPRGATLMLCVCLSERRTMVPPARVGLAASTCGLGHTPRLYAKPDARAAPETVLGL